MGPAKGGAQVSCRIQFLELDHFRAIIKASACRRAGGSSHKPGAGASLKAAAVLFWALAGSRKRLLRSLELSRAAWPPAAQTRSASSPQSGFCRQQAVASGLYGYARANGLCPSCTCLAACGVGGCGAALPVFFSPGDQQSGRRSRVWPDLELPWRSLLEMVVAGQGRRQLFGNHAHVCKILRCRSVLPG